MSLSRGTLPTVPRFAAPANADGPKNIKVEETDTYIQIDTDALQARITRRATSAASPKGVFSTRRPGRAISVSGCTSWTS